MSDLHIGRSRFGPVDTGANTGAGISGRRIQDGDRYSHAARKLNLDRRIEGSERRVEDDPYYRGPARRQLLDRRYSLDRRDIGKR